MINVEYRLKLGQDEFIIRGDYKTEKEFFEKMSFFSSLPKTAPGGATDLKLVVRETKKGKYYSLISESEKKEFQLGQHKVGDTLYAKDWVDAYQGNDDDGNEAPSQVPVQIGQPLPQAAPVQAPVQAPRAALPPVGLPTQVPTPVAQPAQAAPAAVAPPQVQAPAVNPQVTAVASNVLARFGINK